MTQVLLSIYPHAQRSESKLIGHYLDRYSANVSRLANDYELDLSRIAKKYNLHLQKVELEYNHPAIPDCFYVDGRVVTDELTFIVEFCESGCTTGFKVVYQHQIEFIPNGDIVHNVGYQLSGFGKIRERKVKLLCGALGGLFGKKYAIKVGAKLLEEVK